MTVDTLTKKYKIWQKQTCFKSSEADLIEAAVLVPLVMRDDEPYLLFNERADHLRDHAGQVCFPGGRIQKGDKNLQATALRETQEENGICPDQVNIIGPLAPCETFTGFHITPFLCTLTTPFELTLDPEEVKSAFEMPLSYLEKPGIIEPASREWQGRTYHFYILHFEGYKIWGATANILVNLSEVLKDA